MLGNKLSPSLVLENLLQQDFTKFAEHAASQGLTLVIDDHKQVYQQTAYFLGDLVRVAPDCNRSYCEDSFSGYSGSV